MADVRHTEFFDCSPEQFFKIITDYENYPTFLNEVKSCRVLSEDGDVKEVEYQISVIKNFSYINKHKEMFPRSVTWEFESGDLFKSMRGHWILEPWEGQTKAEYYVEAQFGLFVPGSITKKVLSVNLPAMMDSYHERVKELYENSESVFTEEKIESQKEDSFEDLSREAVKEEETVNVYKKEEEMSREKIDLNWDDDKKSGLSDTLKKLLATGLSSAFMSEDQLKQTLSGLNLPKDVLMQVLKGAQKSKDDLMGKVGNEFTKLIQKIDVVKELKSVLREHKISVKADIEFVPKNNSSDSEDS